MTRPILLAVGLALTVALPALAGEALPMKSKAPAAGAATAAAAPVTAPATGLPDGRALLRAYTEACGGMKALDGIDSAVVSATYSVPAQGMSGKLTIAFARPDKIRSIGEMSGIGRIEQGYDGTTGWESNPLTGPRLLGEAELEQLRTSETNVFNLQSLDELYTEAETLGKETFGGAEAWKVRLVGRSGNESEAYFDPSSGYMIGMKTTVASQLGQIPAVITLSDYKSFGKLKLPARSKQSLLGGAVEATSTIESVEYNPPAAKLPSFDPPPEIVALKTDVDTPNTP